MSSQDESAAATVMVLAGDRLLGSAVLVDERHVLTAAHVLRYTVEGQPRLFNEVDLGFPFLAVPGERPPLVPAVRVGLGADAETLDVAVLELAESPPRWLPSPVPVWPARRLPSRVALFGCPKGDPARRGGWRAFTVAGPVAGGGVQADWAGTVGSWAGHSGGPVLDAASGALCGAVTAGSYG